MPVIPATQEAEAGESLELRRAEIAPLHFSLDHRVRFFLKKKKIIIIIIVKEKNKGESRHF